MCVCVFLLSLSLMLMHIASGSAFITKKQLYTVSFQQAFRLPQCDLQHEASVLHTFTSVH